jgi:thiol-disulfide isomerase/thioredoxin
MKKQKRKVLALAIALIMVFTLTACGSIISTLSPSPTPAATPEPTPEPEPDPIVSVHTRGLFPYAFSAEDIFGNTVTEQTMGEKELFFVYRWATWCGACVAGFPNIAQMITQYEDRVGFVMLLLDMDNSSGAVSLFENNSIPKTDAVLSVDGRGTFDTGLPFMVTLETGFIPEAIVMDAQGNVLQHLGGSQTYAKSLGVLLDSPDMNSVFSNTDVSLVASATFTISG